MRKWRPSLWLVVFGGLGGTLAVSFLGLVALRYLEPVVGFKLAAGGLGVAITLCTALLGWLLVRLLLHPMEAVARHARAIRTGATAPAPQHFGTRELRALAASVTEMGAALQGREAAIRTYTDHVTHELKTPVTAIRVATELLEDGETLDPQLLSQISGATTQLERQLASLRAAAAAREPGHAGTCRLSDLAPELEARHPGIAVTGKTVGLPLAVSGLRIVFEHLIRNAQEAGATQITIAADAGGVTFIDNGHGVSEGNANRIFDNFFTTRRDQGGTGMGLNIVRSLLSAHGWTIRRLRSSGGLTLRLDAP